ncbi:MAG: transcriptional repressor, partial [Nitrospira sp.]|nr:transcriptional repressor [Nitrospira sp.]
MKTVPETIRQRFKEQGLKITPQRTAIYKALIETASHPTAEDLYRHVSQD